MPLNDHTAIPHCSIAMATWNGEAFLREQLDSILKQSFGDFELVISDDASTDGTRTILESYAAHDQRIRLYFNEHNLGYRGNFYKAIGHCRADRILLSDQDDRWLPHKTETLLEKIGENLLVFSDSRMVDEKGNAMGRNLSDTVTMLQPGTPSVNRGFVTGNCVWGHTILFRRALLEHILHHENEHPHDWWLAVVSSHLNQIVFCNEVLNEYRQHSGNLTQAIPRQDAPKKRRKLEEYETQLSRLKSIRDLAVNEDRVFYEQWYDLFLLRQQRFPLTLFFFLLRHQRDVFRMKRKNMLSRIVEIRKMCRKC